MHIVTDGAIWRKDVVSSGRDSNRLLGLGRQYEVCLDRVVMGASRMSDKAYSAWSWESCMANGSRAGAYSILEY